MQKQDELVKYRLEKASEEIKNAHIALENELYRSAVSAAYYAMFHAARALLAKKELSSKSHSGLISVFSQNFVKPGMVDKNIGRILTDAYNLRIESDYEDFFYLEFEEAKEAVDSAILFVEYIQKMIVS